MRHFFKLVLAVSITAILFAFVACNDPDPSSGIDYTNYTGQNAAIFFENKSAQNVVAFAGTPRDANILGGIPSGTGRHGVRNNPDIFNATRAFVVFIITEAQYNANKSNLSALDNTPFTRLYVFYNHQGENIGTYDISGLLGGGEYGIDLLVPPGSVFNVEIRLNGTRGEPLGFASAGMAITRLWLQPEQDFILFPVFHRYNPVREILQTIYPTNLAGRAIQYPIVLSADGQKIFEINMTQVLNNTTDNRLDLGAAYISVINNFHGGAIRLLGQGGQPIRNSVGVTQFTGNKTFEVLMPSGVGQASFATSYPITDWKAGPWMDEEFILEVGSTNPTARTFNLENGKMYVLNVSGNPNLNQDTDARINMTSPTDVVFTQDNF
jgi:hypothetical protein